MVNSQRLSSSKTRIKTNPNLQRQMKNDYTQRLSSSKTRIKTSDKRAVAAESQRLRD